MEVLHETEKDTYICCEKICKICSKTDFRYEKNLILYTSRTLFAPRDVLTGSCEVRDKLGQKEVGTNGWASLHYSTNKGYI
jgi:hypothetical protein